MIKFMKRSSASGATLVLALLCLACAQRAGLLLVGQTPLDKLSLSVPTVDGADQARAGPPSSNQADAPQFDPRQPVVEEPPRPPLGLPPVSWPTDNPYTPAKVELGKLLFFDKRISSGGSISCASCHDPAKGFADGAATPLGSGGQRGFRSTPTIINHAYSALQFWDGRASSLEEQAKEPLANPIEMTSDQTTDLAHRHVVERLKAVSGYIERFTNVFGTADFSIDHVARAIAAFERTVLSGNSPYDRYLAGDDKALTPAQERGMDVFFKKAACDRCHVASNFIDDLFYEHDERSLAARRVLTDQRTGREVLQLKGFNFTDGSFQNTGIGMDKPDPDLGRYLVTREEKHKGAFKTPTLREVEHTAPYMHDGSLKTLEDVVDYYDRGGIKDLRLSQGLKPLGLTSGEKKDLVAFLKALSGEGWQQIEPPDVLPR